MDDYHTTYSDGSGQQFITMVSKSGAYFYLVIDRAADGDETVHFMNLVDEDDLLALMDEEDIPQPEPEKEEGGAGKLVLVLLVLADIAGGGGCFWMKMQQKKREPRKTSPEKTGSFLQNKKKSAHPGCFASRSGRIPRETLIRISGAYYATAEVQVRTR